MTFVYPSQNILKLTKSDWDIIGEIFKVNNAVEFREKLREGFTPTEVDNLETKIKKANLRIKEATATIKEHEAKYVDTFDAKPTRQGLQAIKKYADNQNLNDEQKQNLEKFIEIRKDVFNPRLYSAKCTICNDGDTYESYFEGINDIQRHLQQEHKEKVMV